MAADKSPVPMPLEIGTVLVLGMQDYNDPDTAVVRLVQC